MTSDLPAVGPPDPAAWSARLAERADAVTAERQGRQHRCLRGIRGVPFGDVARLADAAWREADWSLPEAAPALGRLFATAWEDGLVAVGLLGAAGLAAPEDALHLGLDWATRVDDVVTADALGWFVIGPAARLTRVDLLNVAAPIAGHARDEVRRVVVAAALASTPTALEGPAAAPLRAALDQPKLRMADAIDGALLARVIGRYLRDDGVQRAVRRLIATWGAEDAAGLRRWAGSVKGGLPPALAAEARKWR